MVSNYKKYIHKINKKLGSQTLPNYKKIYHANYYGSSSTFGRASIPGQTKTGLGPRVYPFTTTGAVLPGSDAGGDAVKPSSDFVIRNRQTSCFMWCPMYGARY